MQFADSVRKNLWFGFLTGAFSGLSSTHYMECARDGELKGVLTIVYLFIEILIALGIGLFLFFGRPEESYFRPRFSFGLGMTFSLLLPPVYLFLVSSSGGRNQGIACLALLLIVTVAILFWVKRAKYLQNIDLLGIAIVILVPLHCAGLWWLWWLNSLD